MNTTAQVLLPCPGQLFVADSGYSPYSLVNPEALGKVPVSIVERTRSLSGSRPFARPSGGEKYPLREAHYTGEEPGLDGVRFVCPQEARIRKH